jgi:parallel beta-helix repeat protein
MAGAWMSRFAGVVFTAGVVSAVFALTGCGAASNTQNSQSDSPSLAQAQSTLMQAQSNDKLSKRRLSSNAQLRTLYVSQADGRPENDGLSESAPLPDIQSAMDRTQPGDTVLVKNGTYSRPDDPNADVVNINRSGTAQAPITLAAYPGHRPKITSVNWLGIRVQASYIVVDGFILEGNLNSLSLDEARSLMNNPGPKYGGAGIAVAPPYNNKLVKPHHVTIRNNEVYRFPGGGIYSISADYLTIEGNLLYSNAYYSPYDSSGISVYQNWNSDRSTDYKIIIRGNMISDTRNLIPFIFSDPDPAKRVITDGNGIIVDDSRQTQNFSNDNPNYKDAYVGRTLVENNIVYNNGARGIHVFSSDHVDIVNNTTLGNSYQKETPEGEISASDASDVRIYNNIALPVDGRKGLAVSSANSVLAVRNLIYGGVASDLDPASNIIGRDPKLTNPSGNDFRPASDSPAIDAGDLALAAKKDIYGQLRPLGAGVDIGAIEVR